MEKLTKEQFCTLMNLREGIKRLRKAIRQRSENDDFYAVAEERTNRVNKKVKSAV